VLCTNIETGETVEYVSQRQAAKELGVDSNTVINYIKKGKALQGI
jgi:transposase